MPVDGVVAGRYYTPKKRRRRKAKTPDNACSGLAFGPVASISGVLRVEPQHFVGRETCHQAYQGFSKLNPSLY